MKFRLDKKGVGEVLKTQCGEVIDDYAAQIDDQIRTSHPDVDVEVDRYTTDRGAASVTIADPRGMALQASDGALTKAAAAVGLEVKAK